MFFFNVIKIDVVIVADIMNKTMLLTILIKISNSENKGRVE